MSATMAMTKKPPVDVLLKVKKELLKRGAHGIRGLGIVFRRMDNSGNRKLDRHEFEWGIKENGHNLSRAVRYISTYLPIYLSTYLPTYNKSIFLVNGATV